MFQRNYFRSLYQNFNKDSGTIDLNLRQSFTILEFRAIFREKGRKNNKTINLANFGTDITVVKKKNQADFLFPS